MNSKMLQPQENLVSNLPLLFAAGYPTTLKTITETQLEKFIPFMIQCSLGLHPNDNSEFVEPEWWPDYILFKIPLHKPKNSKENWRNVLVQILKDCYSFHKSEFLLTFCDEISMHKKEELRFVNNYNSTTSLFHRTTKKLLVTFRNENMCYDLTQNNNRKCLLNKANSINNRNGELELMVEPAIFDIYLCDTCDAELYSLKAYNEHERICRENSVIICDSDDEDDDNDDDDDVVEQIPVSEVDKTESNQQQKIEFLAQLNLGNGRNITSLKPTNFPKENSSSGASEQIKRLPRRTRGGLSITKCHLIPFSSPGGVILLDKAKSFMTDKYKVERLEKIERFCHAHPIKSKDDKPRWMTKLKNGNNPTVSFKKSTENAAEPTRPYKFPKRQYSSYIQQRRRNNRFKLLQAQCKPCSVKLLRLQESDIKKFTRRPSKKSQPTAKRQKITIDDDKPVVDFIDLCSSDEDEGNVSDVPSTKNTITKSIKQTIYNDRQALATALFVLPNRYSNFSNTRHPGLTISRTSHTIISTTTTTTNNNSNNNNYNNNGNFLKNNQENLKHNIIYTNGNWTINTTTEKQLRADDIMKGIKNGSNNVRAIISVD